jgi:hypothetical protein
MISNLMGASIKALQNFFVFQRHRGKDQRLAPFIVIGPNLLAPLLFF